MLKKILFLSIATLLVYSPVFLNGFVGDDHLIVENNSFYATPANFFRLFLPSYTTHPDVVDDDRVSDKGSGSVAYRPVVSATYFFDHMLWGEHPAGYHATNIVLHILNGVLLFYFLVQLLGLSPGFWVALLFLVHPIQVEAVAAIGYRSDLLVTFFVLASFSGWSLYRRLGNIIGLIVSFAGYFLALFTKESAFLFPILLLVYDYYIVVKESGNIRRFAYGCFCLIAVFYAWVYLIVFPNPVLYMPLFMGGSFFTHWLASAHITGHYVLSIFVPAFVGFIPGLYYPIQGEISFALIGVTLILYILYIYIILKWREHQDLQRLFFIWAIIFFIPVANIISVPNPMAYRFLYLPGIGCFVLISIWVSRVLVLSRNQLIKVKIVKLLSFGFIVVCAVLSFLNSMVWKNNYYLGRQYVKEYPYFYKGHEILGVEYLRHAMYKEAASEFEMVITDPRLKPDARYLVYLGESYLGAGAIKEARYYFVQAIRRVPRCAQGYFGLGKLFLGSGNDEAALMLFRKAMQLAPTKEYQKYYLNALDRSALK